MNFQKYLLLFVFVTGFLLSIQSCGTTDPDVESIAISGEVVNNNTGNALENAIIEITQPAALSGRTFQTDSLGLFSFAIDSDSSFTVSLAIDKQGYVSSTETFKVAPGTDITDLVIELSPEDDDGGDDSNEVGGPSSGPASIQLVSVSNEAININETGGIVNSAFTFEVQDSAGRSLSLNRAVDVNFSIVSGPDGGESITPETGRTNSAGRVTSNLFAGNAAGVVKIQASIERNSLDITIRSKPIVIAIHGGYPDLNHFSIAPNNYNFEGYSINGNRNTVTVIVGDKFSNPVKPGTPVYFKTTGGIIQGSGITDEDGVVNADLISGDPRPEDPDLGVGYATVTAMTNNENDEKIQKDITILFSTTGANIDVSPTTFDLQPNGGQNFQYTVEDLNGNPMAAGTQISVEAGEGIEVTGDNNFTLGDHLFPGPGATEFSFSIRDTDEESNDPADLTIQITVTPPSGKASTLSISGTRRKVR